MRRRGRQGGDVGLAHERVVAQQAGRHLGQRGLERRRVEVGEGDRRASVGDVDVDLRLVGHLGALVQRVGERVGSGVAEVGLVDEGAEVVGNLERDAVRGIGEVGDRVARPAAREHVVDAEAGRVRDVGGHVHRHGVVVVDGVADARRRRCRHGVGSLLRRLDVGARRGGRRWRRGCRRRWRGAGRGEWRLCRGGAGAGVVVARGAVVVGRAGAVLVGRGGTVGRGGPVVVGGGTIAPGGQRRWRGAAWSSTSAARRVGRCGRCEQAAMTPTATAGMTSTRRRLVAESRVTFDMCDLQRQPLRASSGIPRRRPLSRASRRSSGHGGELPAPTERGPVTRVVSAPRAPRLAEP